ncbi:MAG: M14 family metallopeptidase [Marinilabiliales bacterium]
MKITLLIQIFIITLIACNNNPKSYDWELSYEKSGYKQTSTYEEAVNFCKQLDEYSNSASYIPFGKSGQGFDLPMLIIDKNGYSTPEEIKKSGNIILLIEANIHPGEPEGLDAGFLLIKDIIVNKTLEHLLDNVSILFIPSFNVDGHRRFIKYSRINQNGPEMAGWRTTARNLNLNRDFLKADAIEMQYWLKMFQQWLPDFFIDCHTTDGADYQYAITYGLEIHGNMDKDLTDWQKNVYLKTVSEMMDKSGLPVFPYVSFRKWHDPRSGLRAWVARPMLSEGYTAIQNRPGLLIETHMLKDYKTRVDATYFMLKHSLEILNKEKNNLKTLNLQADERVSAPYFRDSLFHLDFKTGKDCTMVNFKGIDYNVVESDLTGGLWYQYGDEKKDFLLPYFCNLKPVKSVKLPDYYIIPPEWYELIQKLEMHGIKYTTLKNDTTIVVNSYKFSNVKFSNEPYEGHQTVQSFDMEEISEERLYPSSSVLVDMNQRTARVIAHILEPDAPDSYLKWGYFNAIFEQKEYAETYVMEKLAREMIAKNPKLYDEFILWKLENPEYENNQWILLNWFYQKSPYWDNRKDVYPVGRIFINDNQ